MCLKGGFCAIAGAEMASEKCNTVFIHTCPSHRMHMVHRVHSILAKCAEYRMCMKIMVWPYLNFLQLTVNQQNVLLYKKSCLFNIHKQISFLVLNISEDFSVYEE